MSSPQKSSLQLRQLASSKPLPIPRRPPNGGDKKVFTASRTHRVTFDPEERLRFFHAFHRLVHEEQPYTFLVSKIDFVCIWTDVKDVVFAKVRPAINPLPWWIASAQ